MKISLRTILRIAALGITLSPLLAFAQNTKPTSKGKEDQVERVDVDKIKEKYWAKGDESEMGVVQNRLYTKARRLELGVAIGTQYGDPFLNVNPLGLNLGYNFSELFGLHLIGMYYLTSDSSALTEFKRYSGGTANTNLPKWYLGTEGTFSLLYGKLSLVGASIIYYDLHFSVGGGMTNTESGSNLTLTAGIGQRFYVSKTTSIRFDYRMMYYSDEIVEKIITTQLGQSRGTRAYFGNTLTLGFDFFFGGGN